MPDPFIVRPRPMLSAQRLAYDWGGGAGVIPFGARVWDTDTLSDYVGDGATVGGLFVTSRNKIIHNGELTPATVSTAQHDYNPAGVANAKVLRVSCSVTTTWTGLKAVEGAITDNEPGREIVVLNVGSATFVMPPGTGSTAKYQWGWVGLFLFEAGMGFRMRYDSGLQRWRMVGAPMLFSFARIVGGGQSMLADAPGDTFTIIDRHGIGCLGVEGTDTLEISSAAPVVSRYQSDLYHTTPGAIAALGDVLLVANTLYAHPYFPAREVTFTRIGVNVQTAAGGQVVRLGLYEEALDGSGVPKGQPGLLVFDAGTVSVGSTGWQEITISQTLKPRHYWLVLVSAGAPTCKGLQIAGSHVMGYDATFNRINHLTRSAVGVAAGGLPADETASVFTLASANHPAAFLRKV